MTHECEIGLHWNGNPLDILCKAPTDKYCRVMCVHEHGGEGWICPFHAVRPDETFCLICKADGHDCPMGIMEVDNEMAGHRDIS